MHIVFYWGNRGNWAKNQVFCGFAAFLLSGEFWRIGQKRRFSGASRVFLKKVDKKARRGISCCLHAIGNLTRVLFCQALRRAIGGGLFLTAWVFCQAFRQTMDARQGGVTTLVVLGHPPYLRQIFNLTNMTKSGLHSLSTPAANFSWLLYRHL